MALEETLEFYETKLVDYQDKIRYVHVNFASVDAGKATIGVSMELFPEQDQPCCTAEQPAPTEEPKKGKKKAAEEAPAEETAPTPSPVPSYRAFEGRKAVAVATHKNPAYALLIAKAMCLAELANEPTYPFFQESEEFSAQSATSQAAGNGAAAQRSSDPNDKTEFYKGKPLTNAKGEVVCQQMVDGKPCGYPLKEWQGKSPQQLGKERIDKYGEVLCPKHIAMRPKK